MPGNLSRIIPEGMGVTLLTAYACLPVRPVFSWICAPSYASAGELFLRRFGQPGPERAHGRPSCYARCLLELLRGRRTEYGISMRWQPLCFRDLLRVCRIQVNAA